MKNIERTQEQAWSDSCWPNLNIKICATVMNYNQFNKNRKMSLYLYNQINRPHPTSFLEISLHLCEHAHSYFSRGARTIQSGKPECVWAGGGGRHLLTGTALNTGYCWNVQWPDSHALLRSHRFQPLPCHARHMGIFVWLLLVSSPWKYPAALPNLGTDAFLWGCPASRVQVTISRPLRCPLLFSHPQPQRESHF